MQKNSELFAYIKKKQYFCTRFCEKAQEKNENSRREDIDLRNREVAQLVAHHVRDVGVGRSSRLFSTKGISVWVSLFVDY